MKWWYIYPRRVPVKSLPGHLNEVSCKLWPLLRGQLGSFPSWDTQIGFCYCSSSSWFPVVLSLPLLPPSVLWICPIFIFITESLSIEMKKVNDHHFLILPSWFYGIQFPYSWSSPSLVRKYPCQLLGPNRNEIDQSHRLFTTKIRSVLRLLLNSRSSTSNFAREKNKGT